MANGQAESEGHGQPGKLGLSPSCSVARGASHSIRYQLVRPNMVSWRRRLNPVASPASSVLVLTPVVVFLDWSAPFYLGVSEGQEHGDLRTLVDLVYTSSSGLVYM